MVDHPFDRNISRRVAVKTVVAASCALPLAVLGSAPAQAKVQPSSVAYQTGPKDGRKCVDCSLFLAPNACKTVDGPIAPEGWCKIWQKKAG